jgi:hypothetical protein
MMRALVCPGCDRAVDLPVEGEDAACTLCGHVFAVEPPPQPEVPGLATAVRYPFASAAPMIFVGIVAPLYAICRLFPAVPFNLVGQVLLGGYIAQWLWEILSSTAQGKHEPPGSPLAQDTHELVGNFFRFFGALAVAFAPATIVSAAMWWNDIPSGGALGALAGLLALAGLAYYPMALLLIGFSERWSAAFHLGFALRSIARIPRDYALCCVFFLVTFGVSTGLEIGVAALPSDVGLALHFGARMGGVVVQVLLWAVQMRAVGLVYLANKDRLGWFR